MAERKGGIRGLFQKLGSFISYQPGNMGIDFMVVFDDDYPADYWKNELSNLDFGQREVMKKFVDEAASRTAEERAEYIQRLTSERVLTFGSNASKNAEYQIAMKQFAVDINSMSPVNIHNVQQALEKLGQKH